MLAKWPNLSRAPKGEKRDAVKHSHCNHEGCSLWGVSTGTCWINWTTRLRIILDGMASNEPWTIVAHEITHEQTEDCDPSTTFLLFPTSHWRRIGPILDSFCQSSCGDWKKCIFFNSRGLEMVPEAGCIDLSNRASLCQNVKNLRSLILSNVFFGFFQLRCQKTYSWQLP